MVWEYISFPHNIPIAWNFTLPYSVDYLGFVITSNFLKNSQPGNDMAFHRIFPFYGNLYIHKHWEFHGFWSTLNLRGSKDYEKSVFSVTFSVLCQFTFPIFWELYGFLLHPKHLRNALLWNVRFFPYFSRIMGIHFFHVLEIVWISASSEIFKKLINLKCLCFPILPRTVEIHFSHVLGTAWISVSSKTFQKPLSLKCLCFPIFFLTVGIHFSRILGIICINATYEIM